ncbi:MAG: hypothetical protein RLZZ244_114 [Verrucomicrobiota bacterium]
MRDLAPIAKAPSLVDQVCSQLAARLHPSVPPSPSPHSPHTPHSPQSPPPSRLPSERTLASQLGVSRSVLREAIKKLELQGLLEIHQGRGTKIVSQLQKPLTAALSLLVPDPSSRLAQLFEIRLLLEPESARLAALRASPTHLQKLDASLHALRTAPSLEAAIHADLDFHRILADASGNKILLLIIESLADLLAASHGKGFQSMSTARSADMHETILHAIRHRDDSAAETAMQEHLLAARAALGLPPSP